MRETAWDGTRRFSMLSIPGAGADSAGRLASFARALRDCVDRSLRDGVGFPERTVLTRAFGALDDAALADAYAQTVCYALYVARCRDGQTGFDWRSALREFTGLPAGVRALFERAAWTPAGSSAGDVFAAMARALGELVPQGDGAETYGYEDFLAHYAPREKRTRGVFYTPAPVADYVVRSASWLLRDALGVRDGLTDRSTRVHVLDPAAGTGTFLRACVRLGKKDHLHGYEVMPAAWAMANVAVAMRSIDPPVHCRDALDPTDAPWFPSPGETVVVLGNPPWSGHSANTGAWIAALLRGTDTLTGMPAASYFDVDGVPLGEKNPKWLNDDYVKFMRYAQWCVERAGRGVVAFVCNHGFMDHPTFRGVRDALMRAFDRVMVLDLHGNSKRAERGPGDTYDQNVFDVQTGVCVLLLARSGQRDLPARVFHADLWGTREAKYTWLAAHDAGSTPWTEITPRPPSRLFVPEENTLREEYERWMRLPDAMPVYAPGIVTGRDALVWDEDLATLQGRIQRFVSLDPVQARTEFLSARDRLDVASAQRAAAALAHRPDAYVRCLYRPFDTRWLFDCDALIERPRRDVMSHLARGDNLALIARRQMLPGKDCTYFGITALPASDGVIRSDNHGSETVFPLRTTAPNFAPAFVEALKARTGLAFVPEDTLAYVYACFYTQGYRTRYAELLRRDFPRIPWPANSTEFMARVTLGRELIALHTRGAIDPSAVRYHGPGEATVEWVRFDASAERVAVGRGASFEGVPSAAWEFRLGGYAPVRKWLEDRKGTVLTRAKQEVYARMVVSVLETQRVMRELDALWDYAQPLQ